MIDAPNASVATDAADDLQIVARAQTDPNAFAPLYLRYEPIVRGYCQRRLGSIEIAEDATSQVFIRALNALPSFRPDVSRPGSTFRAWLFTIAHNIVIDTRRRDRHHHSLDFPSNHGGLPISESIAAINPSRSPEDLAIANDLRRQVQETLAALPERQRQIVELRLADLTGAEIAESLGMSVSAVKSAQFRAYTTLRIRPGAYHTRRYSMHPDAPKPSPTSEDHFDAWLDAFVAGSSTPAPETSASTSFAPASFTAAQSAALQFHGLAASAEKANVSTAPRFSSYATDPTWEKILMNQQSPEILVAPLAVSIAPPPPARRRRGTMQMINTGLSIAAVIALLIAASATVWLNRDHLGFPGGNGGNDGPPSSQLAAVTMPNGDKVNVAYVVPTKNDCTVQPLTVDQVMAKLNTPFADGPLTDARATAIVAPGTPVTSGLIGTPLADGMIPLYPLDEPTYDQLAATQREWLACAIYGSPLQRWALEANDVVQAEFQAAYMPFFDIEQIREDVEQLSKGGDSALFRLPAITGNGFLPMVPEYSNGWYNNRLNDNQSQITVLWMKADGTYLSNVDDAYAYYRTAGTLQQYLPNQWVFIKDPESGRWLLNGLGLGMG